MAVCVSADNPYGDSGAQYGYGAEPFEFLARGAAEDGQNIGCGSDAAQGSFARSHGKTQQCSAGAAEIMPMPPFWQDTDRMDFHSMNGSMQWPSGINGAWVTPGPAAGCHMPWRNGVPRNHGQRAKRRFCTSFPDVGMCRRGSQCAFAHSREEVSAPLLDVSEERQDVQALTDTFFMYKYKTHWCPIGVQHEWHQCVYAHNYQDARRPISIGYGARLCPYWSKKDTSAEYSQRCPLGLRCPYSHGAKEQLYHPHYFKTVICRDLKGKAAGSSACPRGRLCAFFHSRQERRNPPPDDVDYDQPLTEDLPEEWVIEFLSPPFLPEGNRGGEDGGGMLMQNQLIDGQGQHINGCAGSPKHMGGCNGAQYTPKAIARDENLCGAMAPYAPPSPGTQDLSPFMAPCSPNGQPMVLLMPIPMGAMMTPNGSMNGAMCGSPQGGMAPFVFMPMEGGGLTPMMLPQHQTS